MRTSPVALGYVGDWQAIAEAARLVNDLTHADPVSAEACIIWSVGIGHAVENASFDGVRLAVELLDPDRATYWSGLLDEAEQAPACHFVRNGWVVHALQAAWAVITQTPIPADCPSDICSSP